MPTVRMVRKPAIKMAPKKRTNVKMQKRYSPKSIKNVC